MRITRKLLKDIDEPLRKLIILLNKNGMPTVACCTGHLVGYKPLSYYQRGIQETILNEKAQLGIPVRENLKILSDGYIAFATGRTLKRAYSLIRKTKLAKHFMCGKGQSYRALILKYKKGTSQKNYNIIWRELVLEIEPLM